MGYRKSRRTAIWVHYIPPGARAKTNDMKMPITHVRAATKGWNLNSARTSIFRPVYSSKGLFFFWSPCCQITDRDGFYFKSGRCNLVQCVLTLWKTNSLLGGTSGRLEACLCGGVATQNIMLRVSRPRLGVHLYPSLRSSLSMIRNWSWGLNVGDDAERTLTLFIRCSYRTFLRPSWHKPLVNPKISCNFTQEAKTWLTR